MAEQSQESRLGWTVLTVVGLVAIGLVAFAFTSPVLGVGILAVVALVFGRRIAYALGHTTAGLQTSYKLGQASRNLEDAAHVLDALKADEPKEKS